MRLARLAGYGPGDKRLRLSGVPPGGINGRRAADGRAASSEGESDFSGFTPEVQKIFRAMQRYGLIVADNGSDLYVSGTYDTRWNNGVLNPAFAR